MQLAVDNTPSTKFNTISNSRTAVWIGRSVSAVPILFLLMDGVMKLFPPQVVVKTTVELGYRENVIVPLGLVLLGSTVLYIVPRTAVLGAILLTGYLGGAVATHVRVGQDVFPVIFPAIVGSLIWLGTYIRDGRLREIVPLRSRSQE